MSTEKSIIKTYIQWMKKHPEKMPRFITRQMLQMNGIKEFCKSFPTCEDEYGKKCPFWKEHTGCTFRNKTPREW